MPPIRLNRRRFLGCSAAAGLALSQGQGVAGAEAAARGPVRVGLIGLGNRGTTLLRTLLELPQAEVVALADADPKHLARAGGIVERARGARPDLVADWGRLPERDDIEALVVALPCDLHEPVYGAALASGKHLYGEKPLAHTLAGCDAIVARAASAPELAFHVGFQRRSHPRYREAAELVRRGDLGELLQGDSSWVSSNGPISGHQGWLGRRERSGDWMVEQAVHVWDVYRWMADGLPAVARGRGRRDLFRAEQPDRDVTDHYAVQLDWPGGFHATLLHSWVAPADDAFTGIALKVLGTEGGVDLASGSLTFRDRARPRQALHPGQQPDTRRALAAFLDAARSPEPVPPPISPDEARDATLIGLLVRRAVDEGRDVTMAEVVAAG